MKVKEAMAKTISTASPQDPIRRVAQLMKQEGTGFMPVCEGNSIVGVITDRDIVIRGLAEGHDGVLNEPASSFMTRGASTISPDADLEEAADIMNANEIRRLAVVDNGKLVGILSHGNLVQAARSEGPADKATLGVTRGA